jgi:predicted dehydrogenase
MESWKRKLRMGMVGGGQGAFIGGVHRIAAAMDGQIDLMAGCFSRDYENTKQTGKELYLDEGRLYESYQEMAEKEAALDEDQRIDFVSVVTPNVSHFPIAKAFLEAGIHVVCDKPMTYSLDEAKQLVRLVEDTGLVFVLTHNYTGYPLVREARKLVADGTIGKVRKVVVQYLQEFLAVPQEKLGMKQAVWRTDPNQSGIGGTIGDIGTHCVNLMEFITQDPISELLADKSTFLPDRELDEDVNALFRFQGGGKGVLAISQVAPGEENGLIIKIYGSEGGLSWAQENPNYMELYKIGEPPKRLGRGNGYLSDAADEVSRIPAGHPEGYLEGFANIYNGATELIRSYIDGKPVNPRDYLVPNVYDGLRGMQFIYSALDSCDKNSQWVSM